MWGLRMRAVGNELLATYDLMWVDDAGQVGPFPSDVSLAPEWADFVGYFLA